MVEIKAVALEKICVKVELIKRPVAIDVRDRKFYRHKDRTWKVPNDLQSTIGAVIEGGFQTQEKPKERMPKAPNNL